MYNFVEETFSIYNFHNYVVIQLFTVNTWVHYELGHFVDKPNLIDIPKELEISKITTFMVRKNFFMVFKNNLPFLQNSKQLEKWVQRPKVTACEMNDLEKCCLSLIWIKNNKISTYARMVIKINLVIRFFLISQMLL